MWAIDSGDLHLGVGNNGDTCVIPWCHQLLDAYERDEAQSLILGGDITEEWKDKWEDIAIFNRGWFNRLGLIQSKKTGVIWLIRGNHDFGESQMSKSKRFFEVGLGSIIVVDSLNLAGWKISHGHQFDFMCKGGPLTKISHGLTWFAGKLERAIPILKDSYLDPTAWIEASNIQNQRDVPIQAKAEKWAVENKQRLIIHHTHYAHYDEDKDYPVANPGGLTEGHEFSYLRLNLDNGAIEMVGHKLDHGPRYSGVGGK